MSEPSRVHLVVGGFPPGASASHDMDFVRLELLRRIAGLEGVQATVAGDFADLSRWLEKSDLLLTYTAGPYLDDAGCREVRCWLEAGGRWLALHGTSGGRAVRVEGEPQARRMQRLPHHDVLGSFFLNHPPVRRFRVDVVDREHPITRGLPESFEVADELYFIEIAEPERARLLLTTELAKDPAPGFGFRYERDTSLLADGKTRALGYTLSVGLGAVAYVALGHCHSPQTNGQPFVDTSVDPEGKTPLWFRGSWESAGFKSLLGNALAWGVRRA